MQKFRELEAAHSHLHSRVKRDDDTTPTQIPSSQITMYTADDETTTTQIPNPQITMYTAQEVKILLETEVHKAVEAKIESAIETRISKICDSIQKRCGDKKESTFPSVNKGRGPKGEPGERGPRGEERERGPSLLLPNIRTWTCSQMKEEVFAQHVRCVGTRHQQSSGCQMHATLQSKQLSIMPTVWLCLCFICIT